MFKRALDILLSSIALIVFSPLLLPVIVILALTGEHEIFYAQQRAGRAGKNFPLLKFATMLKNSPNMTGGDITVAHDPRVLPFGHILRKTKINELPQLLNVLKGDMSLIGYRPLTPRVASLFPQGYWQQIGSLRPGLSGIGSIVFRDEEALLSGRADREKVYRDIIVSHKAALELWYKAHQSVWIDLKLIVLTVLVVIVPGFRVESWLPDLPPPSPELAALRAAQPAAST